VPLAYRAFQRVVGAKEDRGEMFARIFGLSGQERLLDIGCGEGASSAAIASRVHSYLGVDHSESYIDAARAASAHLPNAKFLVADAGDRVVVDHGPFDIVIVSGVLHHLPTATIERMLENVRSVLATNGRFIALEPVFTPEQGLLARLTIAADRGRFARDQEGYEAILSRHFCRVQSTIHSDLIRIPYTHIVMTCTN